MTDITELFARDPLLLSKQDITSIVEKFRESRHKFSLGNKTAGKTKALTAAEKRALELKDQLGSQLKFGI